MRSVREEMMSLAGFTSAGRDAVALEHGRRGGVEVADDQGHVLSL